MCVHPHVCVCARVCLRRVGVLRSSGRGGFCRHEEQHGGSDGRLEEAELAALEEKQGQVTRCGNLAYSSKLL